jgi:hypothetical protein
VEIEDHFANLDRRLDRIEQILPTLASKDDLQAFADRFLSALATAFEDAHRHARTLHEDLVGKIKVLGEHRPRRRS